MNKPYKGIILYKLCNYIHSKIMRVIYEDSTHYLCACLCQPHCGSTKVKKWVINIEFPRVEGGWAGVVIYNHWPSSILHSLPDYINVKWRWLVVCSCCQQKREFLMAGTKLGQVILWKGTLEFICCMAKYVTQLNIMKFTTNQTCCFLTISSIKSFNQNI